MWVLTVAALTTSAAAISVLERPAAISLRTSTSRVVSSSGSVAFCRGGVEDGRDEALLDGRVEVGVSVGDGADRAFDLFGARVFGEVAVRAGLQGGEERVVVGVGGEHEHVRVGQRGADRACRLGAVHLGHAQVHEHDVGAQLAGEVDGFDAVRGGADDLDVVGEPDEHRESLADGALVVGDDDADHAGTSSSTRQPVSVGPACMRAAGALEPLAHAR